jgi:hypothetical protein
MTAKQMIIKFTTFAHQQYEVYLSNLVEGISGNYDFLHADCGHVAGCATPAHSSRNN